MTILNLLLFAALFCAALAIYRPLRRALQRFDARNAARRAAELQARRDGLAHYQETLRVAEEQVEAVAPVPVSDTRTGLHLIHYLFQGVEYVSREDAEAARREAVITQARAFYRDLDALYLKGGPAGPSVSRPTPPHP